MSILDLRKDLFDSKLKPQDWSKTYSEPSAYSPSEEEKTVLGMILKHFALGHVTMWKPRVEFNDLSVIQRMQADQMSFNTYQPNNGEALEGNIVNAWRSNAMRPVVRNKAISIAAHATARLIFPKVFAQSKTSDEERDAAMVMEDLMEWAAEKSNYQYGALNRVMTALVDPASIGYTEYTEVYRKVKREKDDTGKWKIELELDEDMSGFQDEPVPVDQLYIENFYEPDIQKQGWLIWRRVISYSLAEAKYNNAAFPNFKHVFPGVQLVYNDANQAFYPVYDTNMRPEMVEEVIYWNKSNDLKIVLVNGVMLTSSDNPNPRLDKRYPFDKFGYELINSKCFYYKSLAFKMMQDANIINTLYPMIIDGTYLNLMPPMINRGGEAITSDVIVPGAVTTLSSPDARIEPIKASTDLRSGMDTLFKVDESIQATTADNLSGGQPQGGTQTAYEISRQEQNAQTVIGLFIKMIGDHVKQYGELRISDIIQYLTIPEVDMIVDNGELTYKAFLMSDKQSNGATKSRKIQFTDGLPEKVTEDEELDMSYDILDEQGGHESKVEILKVNPKLFRELKYKCSISPDVLNPKSEDLERAMNLELYDRAIMNPILDQEEVARDFLLGSNDRAKRDPDKYIKQAENNPMAGLPVPPGMEVPMQNPNQNATPMQMGKTPLPQTMGMPKM
jgi:hypothetical protein